MQKIQLHSLPKYLLYLPLLLSFIVFSCNKTSIENATHADSLSKKDKLAKRIFYFSYQIEKSPKMAKAVAGNQELSDIYSQTRKGAMEAIKDCKDMPCLVKALEISTGQNDAIIHALNKLYKENEQPVGFIEKKIRPSHAFILDSGLQDSALFIESWKKEKKGLNYILHGYLQNKGLHYAYIDSSRFNVNSQRYLDTVKQTIQKVLDKKKADSLFFQPTLDICLAVLELNDRNEAARFIPLSNVNGKAYKQISQTNWTSYDYSSILIYGEGPKKRKNAISKRGKKNCRAGAALYKKGKAPFIIVSGGFVHPFQTKYCEAQEMKKFLIDSLDIPANVIIMEPHARHTTTNIRNANRIMYSQNIPFDKPVLSVTTVKSQFNYILSDRFTKACLRDFGYLPFTALKRKGENTIVYYPSKKSLQVNAVAPLDP